MTLRKIMSEKAADVGICRARVTRRTARFGSEKSALVEGRARVARRTARVAQEKSADVGICWARETQRWPRFASMFLVLSLLIAVTVQAETPKAVDTVKKDSVKVAAPKAVYASKVAPRINRLPFDSVRMTFPAAMKPLFLYISQNGCDHCLYMDTAVFNRPEIVRYVSETLTPVRVDIYMDTPVKIRDTLLDEAAFRRLLGIEGIPAYYFFATDGRLIGLLDSEMDLLKFKRMLVYVRNGHFFKTTWEQFLGLPEASEASINKEFEKK